MQNFGKIIYISVTIYNSKEIHKPAVLINFL